MNEEQLQRKKAFVKEHKSLLAGAALENYETAFIIEYTHNSTAIEGNTLSLMETKLLLEDKQSIGGKALREIYEVTNHKKAFDYVTKCVQEGKSLDERILKDIHAILMENIFTGGIYRDVGVYITGAAHTPPAPDEMYRQIKDFYVDLEKNREMDPITLAAWTHGEFVRIHPFIDGNGRTARMIMNYQLMFHDFLPVSISKEDRLPYFSCLEAYAMKGDIQPFADMIAALEETRLDSYIQAIEQISDMHFDAN